MRATALLFCVLLGLGAMLTPTLGCGGSSGGGTPTTGSPTLEDLPVQWVDRDGDGTRNVGDWLLVCFDRTVDPGANPPAADLVTAGGASAIGGATWMDNPDGDTNKLALVLGAGDGFTPGKLGGSTFNIAGGNTITNPADGTVGATAAAAAQSTMGRIVDGFMLGSASGRAMQLADIENDGDFDLIYGTNGLTQIWVNNPLGQWTQQPMPPSMDVGAVTWGLGVGDIDGDTFVDFVTGNSGVPNPNRVFINDGTGMFSNSGTVDQDVLGTSDTRAIAMSSLPGDWDTNPGADIFVANDGQNFVYYSYVPAGVYQGFEGDGTQFGGLATSPTMVGSATSDTYAAVAGSLNGDAITDVVIANDMGNNPGEVIAYFPTGAGGGGWAANTTLAGTLRNPRALMVFDADTDGMEDDIVVGYTNGGGMQVYIGDGAGNFALANTYTGGNVFSLTYCDVDGDGRDDIIQGRGNNGGIHVWLNCGGGAFRDAGVTYGPGRNALGISAQAPIGFTAPPATGIEGTGLEDFAAADGGGVPYIYFSGR